VRVRLLAAALAVLAVAAFLARAMGRGAASAPIPRATPPRLAARPARSLPAPPPVRRTPTRNIFEYAEDRRSEAAPPAPGASTDVAPAAPLPSPSPAVRVAGLVRRGAELKAALVVDGEMTVAGKGDRAGRYMVLEVDDETGVRLRGPAGEELVLPAPPF
jgi:hypothetical protein